jgi:hypothetical protein
MAYPLQGKIAIVTGGSRGRNVIEISKTSSNDKFTQELEPKSRGSLQNQGHQSLLHTSRHRIRQKTLYLALRPREALQPLRFRPTVLTQQLRPLRLSLRRSSGLANESTSSSTMPQTAVIRPCTMLTWTYSTPCSIRTFYVPCCW